jgi:hypothetical protein
MSRRLIYLLLSLALTAAPPSVHAKMVDRSAHLDSESYWASHAVYLARVTDIKLPSASDNFYVTSFLPIKVFSGPIEMTNRSVRSDPDHQYDGDGDEQPPDFPRGVSSRDQLLVSEDREYHQAIVVKVLKFPEDRRLLATLEQIARLHDKATLPELLAGANSKSELMSGYCLNRLNSLPDQLLADDEIKKLQSLADNNGRPAEHRIAAEESVLKFSTPRASGRKEAEYLWLRGVMDAAGGSRNARLTPDDYSERFRPIALKLLAFPDKRQEAADYLLRLAADQKAPPGLRTTACSALSSRDWDVFNFAHPDARFDRMFGIYLDLLRDTNADVRIMGLSMLFDRTLTIMATRSPPDVTAEYGKKAVLALQQAIALEKDKRVMTYFKSRLQIFNDRGRQRQLSEMRKEMLELEPPSSATNGR